VVDVTAIAHGQQTTKVPFHFRTAEVMLLQAEGVIGLVVVK
jgi:hypothetical protein